MTMMKNGCSGTKTELKKNLEQKKLQEARRNQQWGGPRKPMRAAWLGQVLTSGESVQSNAPALVGILPQVSKNAAQSSGGLDTPQLDPCYMSGKLGHYRTACALLLGTTSSKSMQWFSMVMCLPPA